MKSVSGETPLIIRRLRLESVRAAPLTVPLREPFVIATAHIEATPNVLVCVQLRDLETGIVMEGIGEAATLPAVTTETAADIMAQLREFAWSLPRALDDNWPTLGPCARAGLDMALWDARARLAGQPVWRMLNSAAVPTTLVSNITLSIGTADHLAATAGNWARRGFDRFKVKVGRDYATDLQGLQAVVAAVPNCSLIIDANAGYDAPTALEFSSELLRLKLPVLALEQPCSKHDYAGLRAVKLAVPFGVIADESCQNLNDLQRLAELGAVSGVNLKLAKCGGLNNAIQIGKAARAHGFSLMVGAMVETRLGITAAAHLAIALGGVEYPDLDTAWLLAADPFAGEAIGEGPEIVVGSQPGFGLRLANRDP